MAPRTARNVQFTAKIVDKADMKKSAAQLHAEELIRQLSSDKAIELNVDGSSPRVVRSAFRRAADALGREIVFRRRGDRLFVVLKDD